MFKEKTTDTEGQKMIKNQILIKRRANEKLEIKKNKFNIQNKKH